MAQIDGPSILVPNVFEPKRDVGVNKPLKQVHIHWKALRYGKYETRRLSCNSTMNIFKDILKSANLVRERSFADSQIKTTVFFLSFCSNDRHG